MHKVNGIEKDIYVIQFEAGTGAPGNGVFVGYFDLKDVLISVTSAGITSLEMYLKSTDVTPIATLALPFSAAATVPLKSVGELIDDQSPGIIFDEIQRDVIVKAVYGFDLTTFTSVILEIEHGHKCLSSEVLQQLMAIRAESASATSSATSVTAGIDNLINVVKNIY